MKKLKWEKKICSDLSGCWYETSIKPLKWIFILDNNNSEEVWRIFLNINENFDETSLTTKTFSDPEKAKKYVEKYLKETFKKIKKIVS